MLPNPIRGIQNVYSQDSKKEVCRWTERVLARDSSIPPNLVFKWGDSESTSVMFDVIMCNTWLADQWLEQALHADSHVCLAKKAAAQYKYVCCKLFPKWPHCPATAQKDPLSCLRAIAGKYYLSRAIEFTQLGKLAMSKNYSLALQKQLKVNCAQAYGNAAQLVPNKHDEYWNLSILKSADALCFLGKEQLQGTHNTRFGQATACFEEALNRYKHCDQPEEFINRIDELKQAANASNCATFNADTELPAWETMKATI